MRILTQEERAVVRRAAARALRFIRWNERTSGSRGSRTPHGYQGLTAEDVLDAYVDPAEDIVLWHHLADAAASIVRRITGKKRRGPSQPRRVA